MTGPYETEREAIESPAVQAVYAAYDADPGAGKMTPHNLAMLTAALASAGVALGAYDRRIITWLAGWEPATCAVIAAIVGRGAAALALSPADLADVLGALDLAEQLLRDRVAAWCEACATSPAEACREHLDQLDQADAYRTLAARLGGDR